MVSDFLDKHARDALSLHLVNSGLEIAQQQRLLDCCNEAAQLFIETTEDLALQRAQLKSIASDAHRLLRSLNSIKLPARETFETNASIVSFANQPTNLFERKIKDFTRDRYGSLLSVSWDWVSALEDWAEHAVSKLEIDRQAKPKNLQSKRLLIVIARHIEASTGKLPSTEKTSWFLGFAEGLGLRFNLPMGPHVVASALKNLIPQNP